MRKFFCFLGCALLLGTAGYIPAQAQVRGDTELGRNWDLRIGVFVPERQAARSKGGDVWFTVGAERSVYDQERFRGTFSVDYYGSGGIYNIPIQINLRAETHRLRYGAGVGVSIGHDVNQGITNFAYNLLLGYSLTQSGNPIYLDVRYLGVGRSDGALNGWAFTFGYHF